MSAAPSREPAFVNAFVEGSDLVLLHRDEKGQLLKRRRRAEWSSFHKSDEFKRRPDLYREIRNSRFVLGVSEEGPWIRVRYQAEEWRRAACREEGFFDSNGITSYESDVDPIRRFFSDTGANVAPPRRLFLDIETDSRKTPLQARQGKARVLCWVLSEVGAGGKPRVVSKGMLREDTDEAELELLQTLFTELQACDQVVAWFGDDFDFPVVQIRATNLGAVIEFRRWLWMDYLVLYERANRQTAESGDEKESLKLQDVLMSRIGHGKQEFDAGKTWEEWDAGGARRERLLEYCVGDSIGLAELEAETAYLALNDAVCEVGRCFGNTASAAPITYVDGFLLRMATERGLRFPTRKRFVSEGKKKQFEGAIVIPPQKKGIVKGVHCIDFSGMYPSIILTWNMSPETKEAVNVNGPVPEGFCRAPSTRQGFRLGKSGILPDALRIIRERRKYWSKLQSTLPPGSPEWVSAGRMSTAYKVFANTFYGVIGSPFSRYFDVSIAESITQNGVWLIQMTMADAAGQNLHVVYGDTDSSMMQGATREQIGTFVEHCNKQLYPPAIAATGCAENHIEIAYEKEFERIIWPVNEAGKSVAKNYCGVYRHYKWKTTCTCDVQRKRGLEPGVIDVRTMTCEHCGKKWESLPPPRGKPEVRGLAYKRGDALRLARRMQYEVVEKLCMERCENAQEFVSIVERYKRHVLDEPLPLEEVVQAQAINKEISEYAVKFNKDGEQTASPVHVRVARVLKQRGELIQEGTRISYVVVNASVSPMKVIPAVDYDGACDRFYLWEDRIYPPTMRLLAGAFPEYDWSAMHKVRPRKTSAKKGGAGDGQESLPVSTVALTKPKKGAKVQAQASLFAPSAPLPAGPKGSEPFVVELEERQLESVRQVLARHPGDRRVELRVTLPRGGTAKLGRDLKVCWSVELIADIERAKEESGGAAA